MACSAEISQQNNEPWFAVCLSWIFPGTGQIYAGKVTRGILFLLLAIACYIIFVVSLISRRFLIGIPLAIGIAFLLLGILITIDAFKVVKKSNTNEFENARTSSKDPWLAVFLSLLLPGLGHAYIRKWFFLVLYFLILLVLKWLSKNIMYAWMVLPLFRVLVGIHAYCAAVDHWEFKKNIIGMFAVLLVMRCITGDLIPWVVSENLVMITKKPAKGASMEPTLMAGDRNVVNIFAYKWDNPKVGDIVLIKWPQGFPPPKDSVWPVLDKRIVATEGESVQVVGDKILVNGVERKFSSSAEKDETANQSAGLEAERMNPYLRFAVNEPYIVPKNYYFVLGDNLSQSGDSRHYGAFPKKDIIGKNVKIWWPPKRIRLLD